ncbi:MAG: hemolysin family protein [Kiritimatiellia bacterium]
MIILEVILIFICLLSAGFFAGMETGVVSTNRLRLHHLLHRKVRGAQTLQYFLDHPDHLLGTTLVGTNLSHVAISVLSADLAIRAFGRTGSLLAPLVVTIVILVFSEYLPKAYFQSNPSQRTLPLIGLLHIAGLIFFPVNRAIMFITGLIFPALPSGELDSSGFLTRDELRKLTSEVDSDSKLGRARSLMIERVFDLTHKSCSQVMIDREHMTMVEASAPKEAIIQLARDSGYSRMPVYEGSRDSVKGILNILDVLGDDSNLSKKAGDFMRPASFVGADTPADELLAHMRMMRQPMAIVTDSASRVLGLVTTEDVLEEIIGEL